MPRVGFEPTMSAGERPKTYDLDRAATGTGSSMDRATLITMSVLLRTDRLLPFASRVAR